jgi:HPt (histidine-containing phosphotransfer) domain-containing protein
MNSDGEGPDPNRASPLRDREGDAAGDSRLPLIDGMQIDMLRSLDPQGARDLVGRVVALYLQDMPRLVAQAETARRTQSLADVARAAHALKSSSGNVGAARLAACARRVETAAKAGDAAELERLGAEIACIADDTAAALQKVIQATR